MTVPGSSLRDFLETHGKNVTGTKDHDEKMSARFSLRISKESRGQLYFYLHPGLDEVLADELVKATVRATPPFDIELLTHRKDRLAHLVFDLDLSPKAGSPDLSYDTVHEALVWGLREVVPSAQMQEGHKTRWRAWVLSGCRPGKVSYHVHFPYVLLSKPLWRELLGAMHGLSAIHPGNPLADLLAQLVDIGCGSGGLRLPFTCKLDKPGSTLRPVGVYDVSGRRSDKWTARTCELMWVQLCILDRCTHQGTFELTALQSRKLKRIAEALPDPPAPSPAPGSRDAEPCEYWDFDSQFVYDWDAPRSVMRTALAEAVDSHDLAPVLNVLRRYIYVSEKGQMFVALANGHLQAKGSVREAAGFLDAAGAFHETPSEPGKKARAKPLKVSAILRDASRPYAGLRMLPTSAGERVPLIRTDGCVFINTWRGFRCYGYGGRDFSADSTALQTLLFLIWRNLCGCCDSSFLVHLSWLAGIVQQPFVRSGKAPVFLGGQGTGKSYYIERLVRYVFGDHAHVTGQSSDFEGTFMYGDQWVFVALEESAVRNADKFKQLVTAEYLHVHKKYEAPVTVPSYANYMLAANHMPVEFERKSRRYWVCCSHPMIEQWSGSESFLERRLWEEEIREQAWVAGYEDYGRLLLRLKHTEWEYALTAIPTRTSNRGSRRFRLESMTALEKAYMGLLQTRVNCRTGSGVSGWDTRVSVADLSLRLKDQQKDARPELANIKTELAPYGVQVVADTAEVAFPELPEAYELFHAAEEVFRGPQVSIAYTKMESTSAPASVLAPIPASSVVFTGSAIYDGYNDPVPPFPGSIADPAWVRVWGIIRANLQ